MILIFEGPDNGGKSTICKLLVEQYDVNFDKFIRHHSPLQMLARVTDTLAYPEKRGWDKEVTILDRWHYPSDVTNEPVYTGNESILECLSDVIETRLKELDTHVIYVTAPWETIEERYNKRGDDYVDLKQIKTVYSLYKDFIDSTKLPVTHLNTAILSPQQAVDIIADRFRLTRRRG